MLSSCCPVADCKNNLPDGGFICVDHHFDIPKDTYSLIASMRFKAQRTHAPELKQYYQEQYQSYLNSACHKIAAAEKSKVA